MNEKINWDDRYKTGETPWDSGQPSKELQRVLSERNIAPCRVLELGCGTGTNAIYLAQQGFRVTALDLSTRAIDQARDKAARAGVAIDFREVDLLKLADIAVFPFVFDRGVYHHLRNVDLPAFLGVLSRVTQPGSLYLTLAGNANDPNAGIGPPCVQAHELCLELAPIFHLVQLREFNFDRITFDGKPFEHRGWSALLRRKLAS